MDGDKPNPTYTDQISKTSQRMQQLLPKKAVGDGLKSLSEKPRP